MIKKLIRYSLMGLFSALILLGLFYGTLHYWAEKKSVQSSNAVVEIPYGSSLKKVASIVKSAQLIDSETIFTYYVRFFRPEKRDMQAGYYEFSGPLSPSDIAERILWGREQSVRVVFKEGETLRQLSEMLENLNLATKDSFSLAMNNPQVLKEAFFKDRPVDEMQTLRGRNLEGYLFPDTYYISKIEKPEDILKKMIRRLMQQITKDMTTRMEELGFNLHQVLTLASIVEKETAEPSERPLVASVYRNRLRIGMRLQADPTVAYGKSGYSGKLTKKDLRNPHPYNTYTEKGLPPGPISSVGIECIKAVLWPKETPYLYFVSKNDGTHEFCANLNCHTKAVQRWQIDYFKKRVGQK